MHPHRVFLSAKNTGLNLSHTALQSGVDRLTEQVRDSMQIIDMANFDGTTFTHIDETNTSNALPVNAVRFLRRLPVTLFMLPDDGKAYTMGSPESGRDLQNPDDYLKVGNKTVNGSYTLDTSVTSLSDPNFLADLNNARLMPRFPYVTEIISSGSCASTTYAMPGMDLATLPTVSGINSVSIPLMYGLPTTPKIPSCKPGLPGHHQRHRGAQPRHELRGDDLLSRRAGPHAQGLAHPGPGFQRDDHRAVRVPAAAHRGRAQRPHRTGSLQVSLPVYAPYLGNTVVRRGGTASLANVELNLPVETRRRAQF